MQITQKEVEALAQERGLVLEMPKAWALNHYEFELVRPAPAKSSSPPRKILQTNDMGDLCRFLGKDGVTEMAGKQVRRVAPSVWHLWSKDGELLHSFTGRVEVKRASDMPY
jgi:hypothetical protein